MSASVCRWLTGAMLVVLATACGVTAEDGTQAGGSRGTGEAPGSTELIVFAAASLREAFVELGEAFVDANPTVDVIFNIAGSQTLANQINEGAPADVFASADTTQMEKVAANGNLSGTPRIFATNVLAIAVERGNPLRIAGLADLVRDEVVVVLAAEEVPAGRYARHALAAQGLHPRPVSLEQDVRTALSKVGLGEADATIAYASDVLGSARVEAVAIPAEHNVTATYPIAVLVNATNPPVAEAFVAFVTSNAGRAILRAHGFAAP